MTFGFNKGNAKREPRSNFAAAVVTLTFPSDIGSGDVPCPPILLLINSFKCHAAFPPQCTDQWALQ